MLKKKHAIFEYRDGRVFPDRLTRKNHAHYSEYAEKMLSVYKCGIGTTRRELHRSIHNLLIEVEDCPTRRIDAFCKLLDSRAEFDSDRGGKAARLRMEVFRKAAPLHPLVQQRDMLFEHEEIEAKKSIAESMGLTWEEIAKRLFSDVIEFHRLREFEGYPDAKSFLSRYNVAQVQAALYGAVEMKVRTGKDFKTILRYAKLARLMHGIRRISDSEYEFHFDGPASVLAETRRYGVAMARFIPALISCEGWRMQARILTPKKRWKVTLSLSSEDGFSSHLPAPEEFDSSIEEAFSKRWGTEARDGWRLERESVVLHRNQKVFIPDFVFRHENGAEVLLEVVGFWTPEYLEAKRNTLRMFRESNIMLAVAEGIAKKTVEPQPGVLFFKSALLIKDVLEKLKEDTGFPLDS